MLTRKELESYCGPKITHSTTNNQGGNTMTIIETAIRGTDRTERREARSTIRNNRAALVEAHENTSKPSATVAALVGTIGYEAAAEIVAVQIVLAGNDGRISDKNRAWASGIVNVSKTDMLYADIYYSDEIHRAHMDQIADAMRKYQPAEKAPAEAVEMVAVSDLVEELDVGNDGDALTDYRDSSAYICDAITEAADQRVSIYYCDLLAFVADHPDALEEVIAEGLYDPSSGYDFWQHVQAAEFMTIERDIYDHMSDALMLAALDFIRYGLKRDEIPAELADLLADWCDAADNCDRMDEIPDRIREYFEAKEGVRV